LKHLAKQLGKSHFSEIEKTEFKLSEVHLSETRVVSVRFLRNTTMNVNFTKYYANSKYFIF